MNGRTSYLERKKAAEPPLDMPARGAFLTPVSMSHVTDASSGHTSPLAARPSPPGDNSAKKGKEGKDVASSSDLYTAFVMGSVKGPAKQAWGGMAGGGVAGGGLAGDAAAPPPASPTPPASKLPRRPESARPYVRPHSAVMSQRGGVGPGAVREKPGGTSAIEELSSLQQAIALVDRQHLPKAPAPVAEPRQEVTVFMPAGANAKSDHKPVARKPRVWSAGGELWGEGSKRHSSPAGLSRARPLSGDMAKRSWDPVTVAASAQGGPAAAWTNAQDLPVAVLQPLMDTGLLLQPAEMRDLGFPMPMVERLQRLIYVHSIGFHKSVLELCAGSPERKRTLPRIWHTFLAVWRHHLGTSFPDDVAQLAVERDVATTEYMSLKAKMASMEQGMERLVKESLARLLKERDDTKEKEAQWQQREAETRQLQERLHAVEAAKAKADMDNETLSLMLAHADSKEWLEERRSLREELLRVQGDAVRTAEQLRHSLSVSENACQKLYNELQGVKSELASAVVSRDEAIALADTTRKALEEQTATYARTEEEMKEKIKHLMWSQALTAGKMEGMKQELGSKAQDKHEVAVLKDQVRRLELALSTAAKEQDEADARYVVITEKLERKRKKKNMWRDQSRAAEERTRRLQEAQHQEVDQLQQRLLRQVQDAEAEVQAQRAKLTTWDQRKQAEVDELVRRHEELVAKLGAQWKEELRAAEQKHAKEVEQLRGQLSSQGSSQVQGSSQGGWPVAPRAQGEAAYNVVLQQELDALRDRLAYMSQKVTDAMAKEDEATAALLEKTKEARRLASELEAARLDIAHMSTTSMRDEFKAFTEQAHKREEEDRAMRRQLEERLREMEAAVASQARVIQDNTEMLDATRRKLAEAEEQAASSRSKLDVTTGRILALEHASLRLSEAEAHLAREREKSAALAAQVKLLSTSQEQLQLGTQTQLAEKQHAVEQAQQQRQRAEAALEALKQSSAQALMVHDTAERELKHFARSLIEETCSIEGALRKRVTAASAVGNLTNASSTAGHAAPTKVPPPSRPLQGVTWVQLMVLRGAIDIITKRRPWDTGIRHNEPHHEGREALARVKQAPGALSMSLSPASDLWADLEGKLLANAAVKMEWVALDLLAQLRADVDRMMRAVDDKLDELETRGEHLLSAADDRLRRLPAMVASLSSLADKNRAMAYQLATIKELYDKQKVCALQPQEPDACASILTRRMCGRVAGYSASKAKRLCALVAA
eukprot:jgi/Mesvir1/28977/Mv17750-RA.2